MKLKPVEEKSRPVYPTLNEFLTAADGIGKPHWGRDMAGAAVFVLALSVGGCDTPSAVAMEGPAKQPAAASPVEQTTRAQREGKTVVAPIFDHGVGRGSIGCVVIAPPSFLSEEEAMTIIKDELAKHGVTLEKGEKLEDVVVQIPCHDRFGFVESEKNKQPRLIEPRPLAVDAMDKGKDIAVVFVSRADCVSFELPKNYWCTASHFTPKKLAADLAASAQKSGDRKRYVGFFYDPLAESREGKKSPTRLAHDEEKQGPRDTCKELLRQQVRDFASWLEKQGVEAQHAEESETPEKSN